MLIAGGGILYLSFKASDAGSKEAATGIRFAPITWVKGIPGISSDLRRILIVQF